MPIKKITKDSLTLCLAPPSANDIIGSKIGRWTVVGHSGKYNKRHYMECRCSCGTVAVRELHSLKSGKDNSCGCARKESCSKRLKTHGESPYRIGYSKLYSTWAGIKGRCYVKKHTSYPRYGAIGIKMCERWHKEYLAFKADMGEPSSPELTIERIDSTGHYSCGKCPDCIKNGWPLNCKWDTEENQANNKRNNVYVALNGMKVSAAQADRILGYPRQTVGRRIKFLGWSQYDALTIPVGALNMKGVFQYDLDGEPISSYRSISKAAEALNICRKGLANALTTTKIYSGFKWESR